MEDHITQKALEESDKKYRMLFEKSNDAIVVTTTEGTLLDINSAGLQLFGCDCKETALKIDIAKNYYASPEDSIVFRNILESHGFVSDYEVQLKKKNGKIFTAFLTSNLHKNDKGEIIVQSIIRDVWDQRRLQQQLRQEQKMEAVGQLAGGIAHDINNILSAITGYGYLIKMQLPSDDPVRADVEQILEAAHRAGDLTRGLSGFSLRQAINPVPININDLIMKAVELLSWFTGDCIEVVTALANKEITCMVDAAQIEQVLINLATNARNAMPEGGRLSLKTEIAQFDDIFIARHGFGRPGTYVLISVCDTGIGMDQKVVSNIFEPFYTTNETGKVTGLGLSIIYGIIKQHKGYIEVNSEVGKGSTFNIYLPITETKKDIVKPTNERTILGGRETILVAEDDDQLLRLYETVLVKHGYKVILARDGEEAIKKFSDNNGNVHLVVLDMVMPKKNGKETYEELRKLDPAMRFLFISGYTATRLDNKTLGNEAIFFMTKPVYPKDLLDKLREILNK